MSYFTDGRIPTFGVKTRLALHIRARSVISRASAFRYLESIISDGADPNCIYVVRLLEMRNQF